jgi:uncharacterized membrane protein
MLEQTANNRNKAANSVSATRSKSRLWEIDSLRGVAIVMMIIYHLLWDINAYTDTRVEVYSGFWWLFARCCATLFVSLSGISLVLNWQSAERAGKPAFPKILKRAGQVFGCGMLITLVTYFAVPRGVIWFGILHVIGLSMVVAYFFVRLKYWNIPIGLVLMFAGFELYDERVDFPFLVWLGLKPYDFGSVDYFPFLPWFGVMLIGVSFGWWLAKVYDKRKVLGDWSGLLPVQFLAFLGRHSLVIYMVHQPVLIVSLLLTGVVDIKVFTG